MSNVSGLPQESCVVLSVTNHMIAVLVERSLSLITVSSILLLKQEVDRTSHGCFGLILLVQVR